MLFMPPLLHFGFFFLLDWLREETPGFAMLLCSALKAIRKL